MSPAEMSSSSEFWERNGKCMGWEEPPGLALGWHPATTLAVHACLPPRVSRLLSQAHALRVVPLETDTVPQETLPPNLLRLSWRPPILGFSQCSNHCSFSNVFVTPQGQALLNIPHSHLLLPEYPITLQACTPN